MQRFKNILLVDPRGEGARATVNRAADLARRNNGRLTVLGITESIPTTTLRLFGLSDGEEFRAAAEDEVRSVLRSLVAAHVAEGIQISVDATTGTAFLEAVRRVILNGHDLVIVNAEGAGRSWFGSTATHLLRKCPCPVWVLRPTPVARYGRILAAVDHDPMDETRSDLNRRILEISTSLARIHGSELHVATAWSVLGESAIRSRVGASADDLTRIREKAEMESRERLDRMLSEIDTSEIEFTVHMDHGRASVTVPRHARELGADLIVMGTVGRTGIAGLLIGNTAERILAEVECPILAVKPKGFVSPVQVEAREAR